MARRRKRRTLKPRMPKRVKRKKRGQNAWAPASRADRARPRRAGRFLAAVLWLGWNGGYVGGWIADGLDGAGRRRRATRCRPRSRFVGALMVARSDLVEVRPFRTGLIVALVGLLI